MLEKPTEYQEVSAQQNEKTVYAEDINQIITNVEKLKGGQANEAPVSNIKDLHSSINELKERIDGLGNGESSQLPSSADKISFNNDNANLDFFSGYDFPRFKNELKERYEIKLITDYSINDVSHIDEVHDIYTLILEKKENKYILKGNLNYNNTSPNASILNFYIISINGNNDFGHIISEIYQFINSENNAKENEILIEGLNDFKYNFGFLYAVPILQIKKQDNSNFEIKNYDITLNIEIENIKNNQDFIPINNAGEWLSFFNIQNIKGKTVIKGEVIKHSGSFVVFSHFALENYFDIKTDKNDGYYVEASSMITSNKNKSIKYYIRKELLDGSDLGTKYANIPITFYYLEIKHTDNTDIENEDNSYSLKGNIEIYEDANSSSKMFIKTTKDIETDIKNIIAVIMTDNLMIMTLIFENYLYLNIQKMTETSVTNETFNNVKLIDNKIALFNNEIINKMSATKVSEDFGIVYEEGKYKIKGQLIFANGESNFSFYTNSGIIDFFEDNKEYDISTSESSLKVIYHHNNSFMCGLEFKGTAGTTYNVDWILPKQI
ncbi:hypothetical protein [Brachyspira hyodysenteriae]|uniref:hypothetical protein n=1 Tax=Brachyspira hyodysenteriae TaxID=159 RepID=UPI00063DA36B|nr:hypothetical protein [Brachyspira hyodysenteriae]KLI61656.1 hypothetical protein SZ44_00020 [Brachyspira hyodysenteriae]